MHSNDTALPIRWARRFMAAWTANGWFKAFILTIPIAYLAVVILYWYFSPIGYIWLQLATGSSWPDVSTEIPKHPVFFTFFANMHVLLNVSPLLAALWAIVEIFKIERRLDMQMSDLLASQEATILNQIMYDIPELRPQREDIKAAIHEASKRWQKNYSGILLKGSEPESIAHGNSEE